MTTPTPVDSTAAMKEAVAALAGGESERAREVLDGVIAAGAADVSVWLLMAKTRAAAGDLAGQAEAIDRALALAPRDLRALLAKADHLAEADDARSAAKFYRTALHYLPRADTLSPDLQAGLRRAESAMQKLGRALEDYVRERLHREGMDGASAPPRFATAVEIAFGRKRPYVQAPRYLYYPELSQIQFYPRRDLPWLDEVEAATDEIRAELMGVIGGDFRPYVTGRVNRPYSAQAGLLDNPDWSAFFLIKDGVKQSGAERCPRTLSALANAPLTTIPNRAPSVLFSKLAGGARIPPHTGMLNARFICHLPLIVPPGCEFRVGNDVRTWVEGRAWAFDDTIEHEAHNASSEDRYILIFDVWRPELSEEERACVAKLCEAIDGFGEAAPWDA